MNKIIVSSLPLSVFVSVSVPCLLQRPEQSLSDFNVWECLCVDEFQPGADGVEEARLKVAACDVRTGVRGRGGEVLICWK